MKKKSKNNSDNLIIDLANKIAMERNIDVYGKKLSSVKIKKLTKEIRKIINNADNKHFVSYSIENGKVLWLWISKIAKDNFDGKIISVNPFWMDSSLINSGGMERTIIQARKFHKAQNIKLQVLVPPLEEGKILFYEKEGFKVIFHHLIAKVEDSLKYLIKKKKELPDGYKIRTITVKSELKKFFKIEIEALKSDKTSLWYNTPAKKIGKILLKHRQDNKFKRGYWGLYFKDKLIGGNSVAIIKSPVKIGLIETIVVLSAHRGRGFSTNLYSEGLNWLKTKKIERYSGGSSTERVLSRIDKMKRKIVNTFMRA
ncbi:MAG: GNAT family N-acetyltransferase [Elusimicrobiales bacterium]|nr:GNAT family N-acetyltransferase [Elusimicrobiales bacterium]